jgi:hypothetical protein
MDSLRIINVGLLEGKTNWNTRKHKISACRRRVSGVMDVVQTGQWHLMQYQKMLPLPRQRRIVLVSS